MDCEMVLMLSKHTIARWPIIHHTSTNTDSEMGFQSQLPKTISPELRSLKMRTTGVEKAVNIYGDVRFQGGCGGSIWKCFCSLNDMHPQSQMLHIKVHQASTPCMATASHQRTADVTAKIEAVFEGVAESLLRQDSISIPLRYKRKISTMPTSVLTGPPEIRLTHVSWPAKTPEEARRFSTPYVSHTMHLC